MGVMNDFVVKVAIGLVVLAAIGLGTWQVRMKYDLCKQAGYSNTACVFFAGSR